MDCIKERDHSIEFCRVLFMFGICLSHAINQCGYVRAWCCWLSDPCVAGYIIISGYFGLQYRFSKVCRLVMLAYFCTIISSVVYHTFIVDWTWSAFIKYCWSTPRYFWFLWTYVGLMMCAPLVNAAIDACSSNSKLLKIVMPLFFLDYVWGYATLIPKVRDVIPHLPDMGNFTLFSMVVTYIVGRVARRLNLEQLITIKWSFILLILCFMLSAFVRVGHWHGPIGVLFGLLLVLVMKRIKTVPRLFLIIAPSMFAVYLLHFNPAGMHCMRSCLKFLYVESGLNLYGSYFISAFLVFCCALTIDIIRRFLASNAYAIYKRIMRIK